eukprot:10668006-Alexandrium_andersonii.AAC.1
MLRDTRVGRRGQPRLLAWPAAPRARAASTCRGPPQLSLRGAAEGGCRSTQLPRAAPLRQACAGWQSNACTCLRRR